MSKIADLVRVHRGAIDRHTVAVLEGLDRKMKAAQDYAWPTGSSDDHCAFIKLERIFGADPVDLFGQEAPSLAHNKITVYRSRRDGELIPGDVIMSALVSEQAITTLMLSSNQGGNNIPATACNLGGEDIPPYAPGDSMHDIAFDDARAKALAKIEDALADVLGSLKNVTNGAARKKALNFLDQLEKVTANKGELGFYLRSRSESYGAKRVDLVSEAAHAALHADRIMAMEPMRIAGPRGFDAEEARITNPMLNSVLDHWTMDETQAVAALVILELERIEDIHDIDMASVLGKDGRMASPRDIKGDVEGKKAIEDIRDLANNSLNKYVLAGRAQHTAHCLGMSITGSQGYAGFMHSSLPATGGKFFTLRLGAAYEEGSFGTREIRAASGNVIEVKMTSDDLMMMFRGHPTGAPTPCTLCSLAGSYKALPESVPHPIMDRMKEVVQQVESNPETIKLRGLTSRIRDLIMNSGSAEEIRDLSDRLSVSGTRFVRSVDNGFDVGDQVLRSSVADIVRRNISDIAAGLPSVLLERLMAPRDIEEDDGPTP